MILAVDAMGGDHGTVVTVPAALKALERHPELSVLLVGREDEVQAELKRAGRPLAHSDRVTVRHASQVVGMDEPAAQALRGKKDSSMRRAIDLVRDGAADACVSAGNTGALMATARFVLKTLPGVDRPAICTELPSVRGSTWMLDLGANVDCTAENLFQFAVMGHELVVAVEGRPNPSVGLLNIGSEDMKGNDQVREAARLLAASSLNYVGFVEGDDIYLGKADIVVCDGFVGNVALKTSEGVARMISHFLRQELGRNVLTKLVALAAMPVLKRLRQRTDPRVYNGASLLGLQKIVVKSHGGADAFAFGRAIDVATIEVAKDVSSRIGAQVGTHLIEQRAV